DVARGALQIVGDRPVVLVPIRLAHHVGNHRSHAAELRVTERIARPGLGEKAAVGVCGALGDHDHAIAEVADTAAHALEEFLQLERHFREQDDVRRLGLAAAGEPGRCRDPAGVTAHHLEHEHAGRGARHGGYVESRLARGDGDVLRDRAEAGTAIGVRQIVVDRLRHAHAGDGKAERGAELRHLERGVHGIVAAVIEEVADVVGAEYLDQPLIFRAVPSMPFSLKRAEPNAPAGVCFSARMVAGLSRPTSIRSSVSAPTMPCRPAYTLPICRLPLAVSITPHAEALMTAETPPDWA